jgi:hypothetical protein
MDKEEFSNLLQKFGFNIIDMTEMEGHTYFYSEKACKPSEARA